MKSKAKTALDVVLSEFDPIEGKSVLDVGCGNGEMYQKLEEAGAEWRGIDPYPESGEVPVDLGHAEDMPYESDKFDAVICVNALHHIPVSAMSMALSEIARVLRPDGTLVVIEPRPDGQLSRVLACVDDETEIRNAAQVAMDQTKVLHEVAAYEYDRVEQYPDFEVFCARIGSVSAERSTAVAAKRDVLANVFEATAGSAMGKRTLSQPMLVRVFQPLRRAD